VLKCEELGPKPDTRGSINFLKILEPKLEFLSNFFKEKGKKRIG
jgi:hypothetical protein